LVELVLDDIGLLIEEQEHKNRRRRKKIRVLDVGCGTGAIGIAIAFAYPQYVQVVAIDISSDAIKLSNENANYFLSSVRRKNEEEQEDDGGGCCLLYNAFLCSAKDFTNNKKNKEEEAGISTFGTTQFWEMDFDIIVSNPPYIPMKEMTLLTKDVINYESYDALCGGNDGLDVVRDIIHHLPEWTTSPTMNADNAVVVAEDTNKHSNSKRTTPRYCWMEVDDTHPIMLEEWLSPGSIESIKHGVEYCDRRKDCFGRDRFVKFRVL
jgi:release factor glutamine methyltransferase